MRRLPARRAPDNLPRMGSAPTTAVRGQGLVDAAFEDAWLDLCARYPEGSWFRDSHLAEGKGRFHRIVRDLFDLIPPGTERPVLDVGCYNGFFCYLLHKLGYQPKQLVYREYPLPLLVGLVEEAGFTVVRKEYFGSRPHPDQAPLVRLVKSTPTWAWMQKQRLFGSGIHLMARRRD